MKIKTNLTRAEIESVTILLIRVSIIILPFGLWKIAELIDIVMQMAEQWSLA